MTREQRDADAFVRRNLLTIVWMFVCGLGAALLIVLLLQRLGLPVEWLNASFFVLGAGAAAAIAWLSRTLETGAPKAARLSAPALFRGLALSADTISAAFFLGLAGTIFVLGDDGLAFALGLGGGYLLLQLVVAPLLGRFDATSVPELFGELYGGTAPRLLSIVVVAVSMLTLIVAQLIGAGLIGARLLGLSFSVAVYLSAGVLFACFLLRGRGATPWVRSILFLLVLAAYLAPVVQLSAQWYGLPVPQLAYANALGQVQSLEETLLEQELADPITLKPILTPFLALNPLSFLGVVLGLAVGMASLPNVLAGHVLIGQVRGARWSAVWGLIFAGLLLTAAPAYAAFAKLELYTLIAEGVKLADLPAWIFTYGKLGLVEVCGQAATDAAIVIKACAEAPDAPDALRLQDLTLHPDMIVLAMPEIAGLGHWLFGLLAAAGLAAALATADGPLRAIAGALGCDARVGSDHGDAPSAGTRLTLYAIALAVAVVAAFAATTRPASILTVATWAFTLAAAGIFPALAAGLWWSRANAWGAAAGMLSGFSVCLYYLIGTHYFAVSFFETWGFLSSAGPMTVETFSELKEAWSAADTGPAKDAAWIALDAHARDIANWWGINNLAAALLALPAGIVTVLVVSLVTPAGARAQA